MGWFRLIFYRLGVVGIVLMSPFSWQLYFLGRRDLPYFETFLLGRDLSYVASWFLPEDHPLWRGVLLSPGIGPGTDRWGWVPQSRVLDPDRVLEGMEVHMGCVRSSWREEEGVGGRTTWLLRGVDRSGHCIVYFLEFYNTQGTIGFPVRIALLINILKGFSSKMTLEVAEIGLKVSTQCMLQTCICSI